MKTPADLVIERFGSVQAVADVLELNTSCIRHRKGRGRGTIPLAWQKPLLAAAKKQKVRLTAEELIYGGQ